MNVWYLKKWITKVSVKSSTSCQERQQNTLPTYLGDTYKYTNYNIQILTKFLQEEYHKGHVSEMVMYHVTTCIMLCGSIEYDTWTDLNPHSF